MAAPGFAIPNILGNLLIEPVESSLTTIRRKGSQRKRTKVIAKAVTMMKQIRPKNQSKGNGKGESRLPMLRRRSTSDVKSTGTQSAKGRSTLLLARPSNKAIMQNASEATPASPKAVTFANEALLPVASQPDNSIAEGCTSPGASAISAVMLRTRSQTPKRAKSESKLPIISAPLPRKASQILGTGTSATRETNPKVLREDTSRPAAPRDGPHNQLFRISAPSSSKRALRIAPSRPKLQPVWIPRAQTSSPITVDFETVGRTQSLRSLPDSSSWATTSNVSDRSTQTNSPQLPRKSSQRFVNNRGAGMMNRTALVDPGTANEHARRQSDPSSIYSQNSVGTSIIHGSNFHYDDANIIGPDSETLPAINATLRGLPRGSTHSQPAGSQIKSVDGTFDWTIQPRATVPHLPPTSGLEHGHRVVDFCCGQRQRGAQAKMLLPAANIVRSQQYADFENAVTRVQQASAALNGIMMPKPLFANSTGSSNKRVDSHLALPSPSSSPSSPTRVLFTSRPPSNPDWVPRLDPSQEHVFVIVGENYAPNKVLRVRLPCNMLVQNSKHLEAVVEITKGVPLSQRIPVRFPDIDPLVFELWLRWIYFHDLLIHDNIGKKSHKVREPGMALLLEAWQLGKKLIDPTFQDACTDGVIKLTRSIYPADFTHVKKVYDMTNHGSGLRRLFLAMMCEEKLPAEWRRDDEIATSEIGEAAFADYRAERKENGKRWDKRREDSGKESWRSSGCRFHEHNPSEANACGWRLWKSGFDDD